MMNIVGKPVVDQDRAGFWKLVQLELQFRLFHDRPSAITSDMNSWRVDLPWLGNGSPSGSDGETSPSIHFLVGSRVTFAIAEFYHFMDDASGRASGQIDVVARTQALCHQLEDVFNEWDMVRCLPPLALALTPLAPLPFRVRIRVSRANAHQDAWFRNKMEDLNEVWVMTEVAFFAYMSIIHMLRKAIAQQRGAAELEMVDAEVASYPLVQRMCRRTLTLGCKLMEHDSHLDILSALYDGMHFEVPYSFVARRILESDDASLPDLEEDAATLNSITQVLTTEVQAQTLIRPLAWATQSLNSEVQSHLRAIKSR